MDVDPTKYSVTPEELRIQLIDSVRFLLADCQAYDAGDHAYAKRISNTLRLLLKETRRTSSLLSQLCLLHVQWFDTTKGRPLASDPYGGCSLFSISVEAACLPTGFGPFENKVHASLPPLEACTRATFDRWWNDPVACGVEVDSFSRRDFVEHLGEKDGGTHVDPLLESDYVRIRSGAFMAVGSGGDSETIRMNFGSNSGELFREGHWAAIRTIAHEVLLTLHSEAAFSWSSAYRWRDTMGKRFEL